MKKSKYIAKELLLTSPLHTGLAFLLMLAASVTQSVSLLLIIPIITIAFGHTSNHTPAWLSIIPQETSLGGMLVFYTTIILISAFITYLNSLVTNLLQLKIAYQYRKSLFQRFIFSPWNIVSSLETNQVSLLLGKEVGRIAAAVNVLLKVMMSSLFIIMLTITACIISSTFTAFSIVFGGTIYFFLHFQKKRAFNFGKEYHAASLALFRNFRELFKGTKLIKSYGMEASAENKFEKINQQFTKNQYALQKIQAFNTLIYTIASSIGICIIAYYSIQILHLQLSTLFVLLIIFSRLISNVAQLQQSTQDFYSTLPTFQTLDETSGQFKPEATTTSNTKPMTLYKELTLTNVSYQFPNDPSLIIKNLTLNIPAKKITALVGNSGVGKTTLLDLISGILIPTAGSISIDGKPLDSNNRHAWHQAIAYLPQDPMFFKGSIRENLLWFNREQPDSAIWKALETAQAAQLVRAKANQLDTPLGDISTQLSGGEQQRLMLARSLLRNPSLLLLDEATSALDYKNEGRILDILQTLKKDITILIVTHRTHDLSWADQVWSLTNSNVTKLLHRKCQIL